MGNEINVEARIKDELSGPLQKIIDLMEDGKKKSIDLTKEYEEFGKAASNIGKSITGTLAKPLMACFDSAGVMQESLAKVEATFGKASSIEAWSDKVLDSFGISKKSALDMASGFGEMATGMGISDKELAGFSQKMVELTGDFASYKKISLESANKVVSNAFAGDAESLKALGISLTDAELNQYALANGYKMSYGELGESAKVQLKYNYILAETQKYQGSFAKSSDKVANQQRILKGQMEETSAELGKQLLPIGLMVIKAMRGLLTIFGNLPKGVQGFIVKAAVLVTVLGGVLNIAGRASTALSNLRKIKHGLSKETISAVSASIKEKIATLTNTAATAKNAIAKGAIIVRNRLCTASTNALAFAQRKLSSVTGTLANGYGKLKKGLVENVGSLKRFVLEKGRAIKQTVISTASTIKNQVALKAATVANKAAAAGLSILTKAQKLFNMALKSNPIGIVITLVAGLVAAFVLLYNKSDKFRALMDNIKKTVMDFFSSVVKGISKVPIISNIIGMFSPKSKGGSGSTGLPFLAQGTNNWQGGLAVTQESGGEIMDLPRGTRVYPHDKTVRMARMEGLRSASKSININKLADKIEVRSQGDIDAIVEKLAYRLEKIIGNGGGEVFA